MMTNLMTILERKVFISSNPRIVLSSCPPPCGHFSIQESATGGLSYKAKKDTVQISPHNVFLQNFHIKYYFIHLSGNPDHRRNALLFLKVPYAPVLEEVSPAACILFQASRTYPVPDGDMEEGESSSHLAM